MQRSKVIKQKNNLLSFCFAFYHVLSKFETLIEVCSIFVQLINILSNQDQWICTNCSNSVNASPYPKHHPNLRLPSLIK